MNLKERIIKFFSNWDSNTWFFAYGTGIVVEKLFRLDFTGILFFIPIYSIITCLFHLLYGKERT